jgi:hypothetical protein
MDMTDFSGTNLASPQAGPEGADSRDGIRNVTPDFDLDLRINELVLHGFDQLDRAELRAAVERALSQLFAQRGLPSSFNQSGHVDSLDGGTFTARPAAGGHDIGGRIAQAISRSLGS